MCSVFCFFVHTQTHAVLLVDRDLEAGEEVFLKYGDKTNHDLLLFYGFTLDSDHRATPLSIEE
jgi:hypothetical protein